MFYDLYIFSTYGKDAQTLTVCLAFKRLYKNIDWEGNLVELRGFEPLTSTLPV